MLQLRDKKMHTSSAYWEKIKAPWEVTRRMHMQLECAYTEGIHSVGRLRHWEYVAPFWALQILNMEKKPQTYSAVFLVSLWKTFIFLTSRKLSKLSGWGLEFKSVIGCKISGATNSHFQRSGNSTFQMFSPVRKNLLFFWDFTDLLSEQDYNRLFL